MSQPNNESGLERALRELTPAPSTLDRDRLMFRAGQIAGPTRNRVWPITSGVLALVVVMQTALLVARVGVEVRREVVQMHPPEPVRQPDRTPAAKPQQQDAPAEPEIPLAAAAAEGSEFAYYRLHDRVLRFGAESLPATTADPGPPPELAPITVGRAVGPEPSASTKSNTWNLYRLFQ